MYHDQTVHIELMNTCNDDEILKNFHSRYVKWVFVGQYATKADLLISTHLNLDIDNGLTNDRHDSGHFSSNQSRRLEKKNNGEISKRGDDVLIEPALLTHTHTQAQRLTF